MNRHTANPENKKTVSVIAMRNMALGLKKIAAEYERIAAALEAENADFVEAIGLKTGMDGLAKVCKFCGNVQEGYSARDAAESVSEIAGASAELHRFIFRIKDKPNVAPTPRPSLDQDIAKAKDDLKNVASKKGRATK
jgi:hypothetical protein